MSAAVIVANPLPSGLVAVSAETAQAIDALEAEGRAIAAVTTADEFARADDVLARIVRLCKGVEDERKRLKAPILDLGRALDDAANEAVTVLLGIKADLGRSLLTYQQAENRRREEERRRLDEQRRQAEEAARLAAFAAEQAAKASATADEPAPWDEPAAPAPVVHVPEVLPPTLDQQLAAAPLKSSSVVRKTARKVEIHDPAQVPDAIAGVPLWVIDTKAVEKLAKGGVQIPGVRLVEIETVAAKGGA